MPIYLVERDLPGLSRAQFDSAHRATIDAALRFEKTADGLAVRYLRGVFMPSEGRAVCLFEATDAESVCAVNDAAGVPYSRVSEAFMLAGETGQGIEGDPCATF